MDDIAKHKLRKCELAADVLALLRPLEQYRSDEDWLSAHDIDPLKRK